MEDAEMVDGEPKLVERKQALYHCLDERFVIRGERYKGQQYSQIYFTRLHHLRNLLRPLVPDWKPHLPVQTVLGLEEGKECIVIGTIYKHMKLKPSILDEYSKEVNCKMKKVKTRLRSKMEDEFLASTVSIATTERAFSAMKIVKKSFAAK